MKSLRCTIGIHNWHEVANSPDGYETRACSRCDHRQWRMIVDPGLDKAWITGSLPSMVAVV